MDEVKRFVGIDVAKAEIYRGISAEGFECGNSQGFGG
jgi:hypothetical protein